MGGRRCEQRVSSPGLFGVLYQKLSFQSSISYFNGITERSATPPIEVPPSVSWIPGILNRSATRLRSRSRYGPMDRDRITTALVELYKLLEYMATVCKMYGTSFSVCMGWFEKLRTHVHTPCVGGLRCVGLLFLPIQCSLSQLVFRALWLEKRKNPHILLAKTPTIIPLPFDRAIICYISFRYHHHALVTLCYVEYIDSRGSKPPGKAVSFHPRAKDATRNIIIRMENDYGQTHWLTTSSYYIVRGNTLIDFHGKWELGYLLHPFEWDERR